jgi:hypothetical protein
MPDETATVRVSEHAALRDEILQNKKLTFERPLLIVSAAAVAGAQLNTSYAVWFLPIGLLAFLWLTIGQPCSICRSRHGSEVRHAAE